MRLAVWVGAVAVLVGGGPALAQDKKPDVQARLDGHRGGVGAIAFHPKVSLIATGSGNGLVRVWDTANGRPVLTLLGGDGGEWLAVTADGYVNGSPTLLKSGRWRVAGKEINAAAVLKALHQPEQLARALGATANPGK